MSHFKHSHIVLIVAKTKKQIKNCSMQHQNVCQVTWCSHAVMHSNCKRCAACGWEFKVGLTTSLISDILTFWLNYRGYIYIIHLYKGGLIFLNSTAWVKRDSSTQNKRYSFQTCMTIFCKTEFLNYFCPYNDWTSTFDCMKTMFSRN